MDERPPIALIARWSYRERWQYSPSLYRLGQFEEELFPGLLLLAKDKSPALALL